MIDTEKYELMLDKVISGVKLTEDEWRKLIFNYIIDNAVNIEEGENGRWRYPITYVFPYKGKYYSVTYQCGCTELQDSEYCWCNDSFCEVHKVTKTIEVWE